MIRCRPCCWPAADTVTCLQVYVSGRKRPQGEMNGKSGNLNNCGSQIYPPGTDVPLNEVMCIFDADQVAKRDFFLRTLPFFDGGDDVGMVLSPQVNSEAMENTHWFAHAVSHQSAADCNSLLSLCSAQSPGSVHERHQRPARLSLNLAKGNCCTSSTKHAAYSALIWYHSPSCPMIWHTCH